MAQNEVIRLDLQRHGQWMRLTHKDGSFAGEFNPFTGIIRFVNRGGTAEYGLAARMLEAQEALLMAQGVQE
jgi:hypothetical protein